MGGLNGDCATSQPSPSALGNGASAGSPVLTRAPPLSAATHPVRLAVASLQGLLANLRGLEGRYRSCGDALAASAPQPPPSEPTAASASPSSTAELLAALDGLAAATARSDAEVGQQLASLRRGVATVTGDLSALAERIPALQGGPSSVASPSLTRTPQATPIGTAPNSVRVGSLPARASLSGGQSPAMSPQLPPAALGSSVRSPASLNSSVVAPARPTARSAAAASPASPTLGSLVHPAAAASLPAALLPSAACGESVRRYLANCVEWPPRPRQRNVRTPPALRGPAGRGTDSASDGGAGSDSGGDEERVGRGERRDSGGRRPLATVPQGSDADDFLRRLSEGSPYDMSMLLPPDTASESRPCSRGSSDGGSSGSDRGSRRRAAQRLADKTDEEERGTASRGGGAAVASHRRGSDVSGNGKRQRSGDTRPTRRSSCKLPCRRGRPTLLESVDALVLAQLRADGVALPREMQRELCGCAPTATSGEISVHDGVVRPPVAHQADKGSRQAAPTVAGAADRNAMAPMATAPLSPHHKSERWAAAAGDAIDFAAVLHELREAAQHGGCVSASRGGLPPKARGNSNGAASSVVTVAVLPGPSRTAPSARLEQPQGPAAERCSPAPSHHLLPTTAAWLRQLGDFCALLDDVAQHPSWGGGHEHSRSNSRTSSGNGSAHRENEEDEDSGTRTSKGGWARRCSHTPTTTATRERVSRHGGSPHSPRGSSSASFDTATAGSENDFSIADDLFTSAEEAEEEGENREGVDDQHTTTPTPTAAVGHQLQQPGGVAVGPGRVAAHPASPHSSFAEGPFAGSSSTYVTRGSAPALSSAADATPPYALSQVSGGAGRVAGDAPSGATQAHAQTPLSNDITHISAFEDFWLERGDGSAGGTPASERLGLRSQGSAAVLAPLSRMATADTSATTPPRPHGPQPAAVRPTVAAAMLPTPGARVLAQRNHRHERQRRRTLQQSRVDFLRQRYAHLHLLGDEEGESPAPGMTQQSPPLAAHRGGQGNGARSASPLYEHRRSAAAAYERTPLMNYRAAARELRALCALMQTNVALLSTLQELSQVLSPAAEGSGGVSQPVALQTATQLLLSLQGRRAMQQRIQQELQLRGTTRSAYEGTALTSPQSPQLATTRTSLLVSAQQPLSALGYAPLLGQVAGAAHPPPPKGGTLDEREGEDKVERVARYLAAATPYLLAWPSNLAPEVIAGVDAEARSQAAAMPFAVWAYKEALTAELLEEARKLDAYYQLCVVLVAEATMADVSTRPVRGGTEELLLLHVTRSGRAASVRRRLGVAGARLSVDSSLEKYVSPVSTHLLHQFDRLESRHLMHSVFHAVHLSDVVARRRALQQQQQRQQEAEKLRRRISTSPARPPANSSADQRRSRLSAGAGDDEDGFDSFALPPGTLSSSPALRIAAETPWSMRDAEQQQQQQQQQQRSGRSGSTPVRESGDEDSDSPAHTRGGATNRSASSGSEPRHVTIEGFVRFLTGGAERLRAAGRGTGDSDADAGGSPPLKASPPHPSGLTLDVPHTSSLLREQDGRRERATTNAAIVRSLEEALQTHALLEDVQCARGVQRDAYGRLRVSGVLTRHYYSSRAAAFTAPLSTQRTSGGSGCPSLSTVSMVQCRWQPVFQSTMCFCPVTRRRCLDPLVGGALLVSAPLPPHEIVYASPDQRSTPAGDAAERQGSPNLVGSSSPLPFPATIRALRSGLERAIAVRAVGGERPTPGPSVRRSDAAREPIGVASPLPHGAVIATLRGPTGAPPSSTAPSPSRSGAPSARLVSSAAAVSSLFPGFFLHRTALMPDRLTVPRILTQIPTALHGDSSAIAGIDEEGGGSGGEGVAAEEALPETARLALRAVTLPLQAPPVTRNLIPAPDATQTRWLNPPTLLECGHVVSHKTYLDLRTSARRTSRTAAAAAAVMTVVCCPYCSKVTPAKDALTLSYLY